MKDNKLGTQKLVYGVGINDADYVVQRKETIGYVNGKQKQRLVWMCPYYRAWKNMIERCYSTKFQENTQHTKGAVFQKSGLHLVTSELGWKSKIGSVSSWTRIYCLKVIKSTALKRVSL